MNRIIKLLACLGLAATAGWPPHTLAAPAKPNVIFILADDLGYGDLGCYGQKHIQTPNIDRLAAEGMRFTQAYSGATVCAPSRCALMTGKHGGPRLYPRQQGTPSRRPEAHAGGHVHRRAPDEESGLPDRA